MSNDNDNMGLSDQKYNEIYDANIIGCINSISRSYSSGINAPSVSSNRLRVCSTDSSCPGPLRVRSSPSSPNRLTRFQCMNLVRRKWSALNRINQSSSSEFDSYPTSCNSNKSLQCDSNIDQLDLSWTRDLSVYSLTTRPTSCQNLKVTDSSTHNQDDFYLLTKDLQCGSSSTNLTLKQLPGAIDEEPTIRLQSEANNKNEKHGNKSSHSFHHKDSRPVSNKASTNPINFKKVLRDRYLNSQKTPNIDPGTSSTANQYMTQTISLTDDYLFHPSGYLLPESEDHNFRFLKERDSQRSLDIDNYVPQSMYDSGPKKSLSIDLQNLSALKKYRIQSNNSTVSSMSGIDAEGDPFSPASTEICSPFLKLNLPYRITPKQMSGSCTPNPTPNFNIGPLTSSLETQSVGSSKTLESLTSQRFFPETMKLSDFYCHGTFKSDCQLSSQTKDRLMLPESEDQTGTKSAPQSLQLSPNCTHLLSGPMTPMTCVTTDSAHSLNQVPARIPEDDMYFMGPMIVSKSMDYLDSCYLNVKNENSKQDYVDWSKHEESRDNKKSATARVVINEPKLKHGTSATSPLSKKSLPLASTSNQRQCSVCGRHFTRSDMLARHSRVHTGHKPFECSICGQSFSRSDHLNTHMRIHSGEKPYRCSLCAYSACRRDMITRHLRVHRRKGDISSESMSVLVVNTHRSVSALNKKPSRTKSHNSLDLDLGIVSDDEHLLTLHRSHSFNSQQNCPITVHNQCSTTSTTSRINEQPSTTIPQTFANISISICQPTPRSSFSMPTEPHNDDS